MADEKAEGNGQGADVQGEGPHLGVLAQYVRDLSFENPNAPRSMQGPGENPQLKVNVNVNAGKKGDDLYEVQLVFEANAHNQDGVIYSIECVYGGAFRIRNVPENMMQAVLFVDCPTILFPFLRRIIADVTRDGGFAPLMLDPIDFGALYARNMQRSQAEAEAAAQKN
jgi:preprotein translocase subunit SecB